MTRPAVSIGQYTIAGRKERNDDSFGVIVPDGAQALTKGIAMAIADGMSSSPGAKQASETCIRSFLDDYYCTHDSWAVKTCVGRVLTAANRWLYSQGQALYADEGGMVTTFTGAVLKAGLAHVFHAGDSRLALIHQGECEALTKSHRMKMARGQDYLTRAVGMAPDLAVDFRQVPLADGDILVFTTDGVHDFLSDNAMMGLLGAHDDLGAAAKAIVEAAYNAGSDDNLTCQIVRVDRAGSADQAALHIRLAALPFPPELSPGMVFEGYRILR
jgi:serine/threonine protein phosphatase PrpC